MSQKKKVYSSIGVFFWLAAPLLWPAPVWLEGRGYRSAEAQPRQASISAPGFTRMRADETKIFFTNVLAPERHLTNQILLNGSGLAAGDFDNDGWCDLYFCALDGDNKLYRNLGNWQFQDVAEAAGVACPGIDATAAAFADLDGDRDVDLLVNSIAQGTRVFLNSGKGTFRQVALLNENRGGMSLALADIDGDGDLDLYVANYRVTTLRDQPNTRFTIGRVNGAPAVKAINGRPLTEPDLTNRFVFQIESRDGRVSMTYDETGEPDALYRNDGHGHFTPLPRREAFLDAAGNPITDLPLDWGLSVMFRDFDRDSAPDLYVCNDFKSPDRAWLNRGQGRFQALGALALRQTSLSSMGVDVADINRDGLDDFIVLDMLSREHARRFTQRIDIQPETSPIGVVTNRPQASRNTLFLNRGDGTFAEIAQLAGLEATEWSWTPIFLDVDLDGYEDLLVSSGFERDGMNVDVLRDIEQRKKQASLSNLEQLYLRKRFPRLPTGTLAYRNTGRLGFVETTAAWRFETATIAQGMALADLDNDGDLDVAVNNMNAVASLFRNDCPAGRLAVTLRGAGGNTAGIGARVRVTGAHVAQESEWICGGRYLSSDQPLRTFATGAATNFAIEVNWRSGRTTRLKDVAPNRLYEIYETNAVPAERPRRPQVQRMFEDVSGLISHHHHEEPFDDFARQPLLPHRLSQMGPGVSWCDLDGDGWEELLLGSGRGGRLAVFHNKHGTFQPWTNDNFALQATHDQTTVLAIRRESGPEIIVGVASYETPGVGPGALQVSAREPARALAAGASSTGPLALADYNRDGHLDLFVGGHIAPGGYPRPASSLLFRGGPGGFHLDEPNSKQLSAVGMVRGAVFTDLGHHDAAPELVLACEWGTLRVFTSGSDGQLREITAELGLDFYRGWWTGVTAGDFDGDGRMDLAAGNWGQNTKYQRFRSQPLRLYYGDVDADGRMEILESCFDQASNRWVPFQPYHLVTAALPLLQERLPTAESYARSSFEDVFRPVLDKLSWLDANWLESTLFLNRGARFEPRILPVEAQFAPAFGLCAADFDNDGKEDLFLSQNFFATHPETSRYDGGRGLLLRGKGDGSFTTVNGAESGLAVYGEGRGAAVCDFDRDGRLDLAVAQNGAPTKLFRNTGATPGLRVTLRGTPENPGAIGATVRLVTAGAPGPVRELHAGSGYWSQNSTAAILPKGDQVNIRWASGLTSTSAVPKGAKEMVVAADGAVSPRPPR